jgi:cytochrome c-type biogenesis protein CcmF
MVAISYLARAYLQHPPAAQFHFIVSPLVLWIWIGGLIVFGGGLIAVWPAPSVVRARVRVRLRARAAHRLARA